MRQIGEIKSLSKKIFCADDYVAQDEVAIINEFIHSGDKSFEPAYSVSAICDYLEWDLDKYSAFMGNDAIPEISIKMDGFDIAKKFEYNPSTNVLMNHRACSVNAHLSKTSDGDILIDSLDAKFEKDLNIDCPAHNLTLAAIREANAAHYNMFMFDETSAFGYGASKLYFSSDKAYKLGFDYTGFHFYERQSSSSDFIECQPDSLDNLDDSLVYDALCLADSYSKVTSVDDRVMASPFSKAVFDECDKRVNPSRWAEKYFSITKESSVSELLSKVQSNIDYSSIYPQDKSYDAQLLETCINASGSEYESEFTEALDVHNIEVSLLSENSDKFINFIMSREKTGTIRLSGDTELSRVISVDSTLVKGRSVGTCHGDITLTKSKGQIKVDSFVPDYEGKGVYTAIDEPLYNVPNLFQEKIGSVMQRREIDLDKFVSKDVKKDAGLSL